MAKTSDTTPTDKVGYANPPAASRFKKGISGNPKGRPPGTRNFSADVRQMLQMPVPIERDGARRKNISTQAATLLRLREKALKGDARALDKMMELAKLHNAEAELPDAADALTPEEQAILDAWQVRMRGDAYGSVKSNEHLPKVEEEDKP